MSSFQPLQGDVVLRSNGTYIEAKLFSFKEEVYAKKGNAFLKLKQDGDTSVRRIYWEQLEIQRTLIYPMGLMTLAKPKLTAVEI